MGTAPQGASYLRNRPQRASVVRPDARFDRLGHSGLVTTSRASAHEPIGGDAAPDVTRAVPAGAVAVIREGVGGPELTSYQWVAPADALRRSAAGSLRLPIATNHGRARRYELSGAGIAAAMAG